MTVTNEANGTRPIKLSATTVTVVADGANVAKVCDLYVTEIAGGTPNFSLEIYDGTTSTYLQKTKPATALQTIVWSNIPLATNQQLRATAGTANQIDVFATVVERTPT